jgi:hypothetical protein
MALSDYSGSSMVTQKMHIASGPGEGQFKGAARILRECGFVPVPALGKCTKPHRLAKKKETPDVCDPHVREGLLQRSEWGTLQDTRAGAPPEFSTSTSRSMRALQLI